MEFKVKRYKSKYDYSYSLGMAPTVELIKYQKNRIYKIFIDPDYNQEDQSMNIYDYCRENGVEFEVSRNTINRISNKGNVFVAGVFFKYEGQLRKDRPHVVLVNPSDAGNLGTIIRTGLGFGFEDIAIIRPAVDIFNPNSIRASMGAAFSINIEHFETIEDYMNKYEDHKLYSFMLDGKNKLKKVKRPEDTRFSLVLGNEARGLDPKFLDLGESLFINHSAKIDSLNLSIAFGIAANHFSDY